MALDVADAGVLKRNMLRLLLKHPQGIKSGDFSGAFYKLHGHHPQLALHGYSSLKCLLTDMKNMVVLEKNSQETVIKLANDVPFNPWLHEGEGWDSYEVGWNSSEEGWYNFEEEVQSLRNEEAEDEADPCGPADSLDTDFSACDSVPQKMRGKKSVLAAAVLPILRILQDYPKGLNLQMLTENLKNRGFDLECFSQDAGYGDTIYCLLDMPGLHLIFLNGMEPQNCVVQLLSSSSCLPALPLSAGSSLPKSLPSSDTGTFPQHLMETKPGDPTVLALVSNLLNTYPMGLQVKKLQEFLLTMEGIDLEKFSIAQGYKDTLEFLEHQMPGLKIKYCENRRKCVVKRGPSVLPSVQAQVEPTKMVEPPKTAPAPAEVLALLTNLLKTYQSGLRVQKLQEFLLTMKRFDLEKFSMAQGYKDTLEFLEHQMPELKITYSENRLKCVVKQGSDVKVASPLPTVQLQVESTKRVEPPNATPDFGGISKPLFSEVTKAGPGASVLLQNGLCSSIPVPSAIIPNHPSSKEQGGASSGKDKSSSQPHSDIPAQQSSACQFGGRCVAGELSRPTDAQVPSQSSLTKLSPSEHLDELKQQVAHILARQPEGMSLFQFRAAYSTTYQHHLPLGNASSAKQRLLEMSDVVCMKGYGVQTLLLPVSPEEPPTKPGPPVFSRVENAATVLADSLPQALVRPEPEVVSKPSLLKTPMEPQPHATRPLASDHLGAPDVKENHVLAKGQCPTAPKVVAPLQEPVRPKVTFGGYPDSFNAEEAAIKENRVLSKGQFPAAPKVVAPLQEPVRPKVSFDSSKVDGAAKNLCSSSTEAAVKIEPVVVPKSSSKPSLSKTAAVPVPQWHPSVPSTSTCLRAPGNKESSFLPESLPPTPPKPSVPVGKNVMARAMPGENLSIPHSPVVFPAEPQVSRLNGIWTSDSLASKRTYLANPSFSVNIPAPSLFQPVLTNIVAMSQRGVHPPPLTHLPDVPENPSLTSALYQSVSRTQLPKTELVSSHCAQPASQNRPAKPTSPVQRTEQADCTHTAGAPDSLQSASRTHGQGHSQAPGFSAHGHPVSSPSVKPPSLHPFKSPSVKQPENVDRTWLSSMPCSSVPAADDSVVASPSAGVHSKPAVPARQKQYDALNVPVTSPRTSPSTASHQPAFSSFRSCTESDTVPSKPLVSMSQPHHIPVNSAVTSSSAQPSTLLYSSRGSPTSTASQPSYVSFRPNTGYDASRQSKPLPGISGEGSGQDNHHFTLPDNQRHRLEKESTQPSALQNSPPRQNSNNCVIL